MKLKKGDYVYCIKTVQYNENLVLFTKGLTYKVAYINDNLFNDNESFIISIKPNNGTYKSNRVMNNQTFNKYFITRQNFRKLKLKKLYEIR